MDHGPLVEQEIDAGAELVREFNKYEPVTVAFWMKESDDAHRYLFIASDEINDGNINQTYSQVRQLVFNVLRSPYIDLFRVKVLNDSDPLAKAAIEMQLRYPGRTAMRFGGAPFGGVVAEDVYIYPPLVPAVVA